jgi:ATP-binding cassette subfamily B protein
MADRNVTFAAMKDLRPLNRYFLKYRWRLLMGLLFIVISNYFGVVAPQVTGYVVDQVERHMSGSSVAEAQQAASSEKTYYDPLVRSVIRTLKEVEPSFASLVLYCGLLLLAAALLRGFFMFMMRQSLIVMSRHIEYDQKNEIYSHYQKMDALFFRTHSTGDLMSRMAEDVGRVRMYTGPAIMYLANLSVLIFLSVFYMLRKDAMLTLYVLSPLPLLAYTIYRVNTLINRRSERIQAELSDLTTHAQESFSGIRVIKSFVKENALASFFRSASERYRNSNLNLARLEAVYYPTISLMIGLSTLITIYIGARYQLEGRISSGTIAEFVVYINMLTFPVSALGWVASMIQRAAAAQRRLNEFLDEEPRIADLPDAAELASIDEIRFNDVSLTYPHTGIMAVRDFNLTIRKGERIAIIGRTGSGKSSLAQLMLRAFDPDNGSVTINGRDLRDYSLASLRSRIAYVPQDVFLFSDTVRNNIRFGSESVDDAAVEAAARQANIEDEILSFPNGYETMVGERGVTLSGGQKQRISIARALCKPSDLIVFDDCLSAVDARTEHRILSGIKEAIAGRTAVIITHRAFSLIEFDRILVMEDGAVAEEGTHATLMAGNGLYAEWFRKQQDWENL